MLQVAINKLPHDGDFNPGAFKSTHFSDTSKCCIDGKHFFQGHQINGLFIASLYSLMW